MTFFKQFSLLAGALGLVSSLASGAQAQQVLLTSNDGGVVLRGTIVSVDETHYTLNTSMGQVRALIDRVACSGTACPELKPPAAEFAVAGPRFLTGRMLPAVMQAHASEKAATLAVAGDAAAPVFTVTDDEGDEVALVNAGFASATGALSELLQGDAALALTSRPIGPGELEVFDGSGLGNMRAGVQEQVVALDGYFVVTSAQNPVRSISQREAALVFAGNVRNWSALGGPDAPINLYVNNQDSDATEFFTRVVMRPHGVDLSDSARVFASDADVSDAVAADPFGIGYTNAAGRRDARALAIEDVCGLVLAPSDFNLKSEGYPLIRRHYVYQTNEKKPPFVDDLLDFLPTSAAQSAIAGAGLVDQSVIRAPVEEQGMRFLAAIRTLGLNGDQDLLRRLVDDVLGSERLSTTFRFLDQEGTLDARARADVARLADLLAAGRDTPKVVRLMGFTDTVGDSAANAEWSRDRAEQIRDALLALRPELEESVEFRAIGYGELAPIACNQTAEGRWTNRRVEVWVQNAGE